VIPAFETRGMLSGLETVLLACDYKELFLSSVSIRGCLILLNRPDTPPNDMCLPALRTQDKFLCIGVPASVS